MNFVLVTSTDGRSLPVRHVCTAKSCLCTNIFPRGFSPVWLHGYVKTKGVTLSHHWTSQVEDYLSEFGHRHGTDDLQYLK